MLGGNLELYTPAGGLATSGLGTSSRALLPPSAGLPKQQANMALWTSHCGMLIVAVGLELLVPASPL